MAAPLYKHITVVCDGNTNPKDFDKEIERNINPYTWMYELDSIKYEVNLNYIAFITLVRKN